MASSSSTTSSNSSTLNSSSNSMNNLANISNFVSVKLNNENYLSWKHQMVTILKTLGLLKFINPHTPQPPANTPESENFERLDGYVSACINATLDPTIAHLAIDTTSAAELWKIIEDTYFQNAFAKKSQLHTQFQTIKQGNTSISDYCDCIKRIADSLKSIGEPISQSALVMQTIHGLNSSYNTFVLNVENSTNELTFAQLRSRLLIFEERLAQVTETSTDSSSISAMNATITTRDAPHQNQTNTTTRGSKTVCQICQKEGHDASKCYWRYTPPNPNPNFGPQFRSGSRQSHNRGGRSSNRGGRGGGRSSYRGGHGGYGGWSGGNSGGHATQMGYYGGLSPSPDYFSQSVHTQTNHMGNGSLNGLAYNSFAGGHVPSFTGPNQYVGNGQQQLNNDGSFYNNGFSPNDFNRWTQQNGFEAAGSQFGLSAETISFNFSDICQTVDTWIPDSGATAHMTSNASIVCDAKPYTGSDRVIVGNDTHGNNTPPHAA